MPSYKNMDMNGYSYGSEYEYDTNGYSYGSEYEYDSDDEREREIRISEEKQRLLKEKRKKEEEEANATYILKLKNELGVVSSFLNWVTAVPKTQTIEKLSFEDDDAGWTKIKKVEKIKKEEKKEEKIMKTEMCRSIGKGKCVHKSCRFAHSILELNVLDCNYGSGCRAIYFDRRKNIYMNDKKKTKVCMRIHPKESKDNFYGRVNKCIPVTEEEMNFTYSCILDYESKNSKFLEEIENKRKYIPCNKSIKYEIPTPYNVIVAAEYGLLPAVKETKKQEKIVKKETKKYVNFFKHVNKQGKIVKKENKKDENLKNQQKIANLQVKIEEIEKKMKTNNGIIKRFSERIDNIQCQQKCKSLRAENELLSNNLDSLKDDIERIKNPPKIEIPEPKKEIVIVKKIEETPKKEKTIVNTIFDICAKSFRAALGVVSKEPSQFSTKTEPVETEIKVKENTKTIMCKSYGKYTCHMGTNCRFAHSLKELKVEKCAYGYRCFDVEYISDSYVNRKNLKNRVCNRIHPEETIENVHKRIGIFDNEKTIVVTKCETENKKNGVVPKCENENRRIGFVPKCENENKTKCKTELCRSVGKYTCHMGTNCRFAHNSKELKILPCNFGFNCYDVDLCSGVYTNKKNMKNRICQRQHPEESIRNVYMRLGIK